VTALIHLTLLSPLGLTFSLKFKLILRNSAEIEFLSIGNGAQVLAQSPMFSIVFGGPISYTATGSATAVSSGIPKQQKRVYSNFQSQILLRLPLLQLPLLLQVSQLQLEYRVGMLVSMDLVD
jgi:hypothetical protein